MKDRRRYLLNSQDDPFMPPREAKRLWTGVNMTLEPQQKPPHLKIYRFDKFAKSMLP
jgi:hypothetical protein